MTPRDIACRELVELLTEYLDGVLPPDEVAAVDAHLDGCDACRAYLDQMRATIAMLGSVPVETLSDAACDTLLAAFSERGRGSDPGPNRWTR
jgi:anti-sigma factor RsiW